MKVYVVIGSYQGRLLNVTDGVFMSQKTAEKHADELAKKQGLTFVVLEKDVNDSDFIEDDSTKVSLSSSDIEG